VIFNHTTQVKFTAFFLCPSELYCYTLELATLESQVICHSQHNDHRLVSVIKVGAAN